MVVGRLLSHWEGNFSGAMLNFGVVTPKCTRLNHAILFAKNFERKLGPHRGHLEWATIFGKPGPAGFAMVCYNYLSKFGGINFQDSPLSTW